MAQDLRPYLDAVKKRKGDEFQIVTQEVDPAFEITAIVVKLEREAKKRPGLPCEKVKAPRFPVLTTPPASRSRLAPAMGCAPDKMLRTYLAPMDKPIPPKV